MAKASRKLPRGARAARRPLRSGGSADGYIQSGTFYPFDTAYGLADFSGGAYEDSTVQCDTGSVGGYDSGSSGCDSSANSDSGSSYSDSSSTGSSYDSGGSSSSYDSGSSSSSYDSGSSGSYDSGSY